MAKVRLNWTLDEFGILSVGEGETTLQTFEIKKIFTNFSTMNKVQRLTIANGVKQKLADHVAGMKGDTPKEKASAMKDVFDRLIAGDWKSGGTGVRLSYKKKAAELVAAGGVTEEQKEILRKLGII